MDDIKIFVKNKKEQEILTEMTRIYNQDIRIEFGIETCFMLTVKKEKRKTTKGISKSNRG